MALSVRSNMSAVRAATQLNRTQSILSKSIQRISTGLRINSASDDAAGLAVASGQSADKKSLGQAIRNANKGISMTQTAEGGLTEIYNSLVQIRVLAVQAASSTYNSADRATMNTEYNELMSEINRLASVNAFNKVNLLRSSTTNFSIQVGIFNNSENRINVNLSTLNSSVAAIGLATVFANGITVTTNANSAITAVDSALKAINNRRAYVGAIESRLEVAVNEAISYSETLATSSSQLLDVDYAEETARMTRLQIMQQAGTAALGQAKGIPQAIISLLS